MDFQQIRKYVKGVLTNSFLNKTTLDKLSTSDEGNLLFDGKGINGGLHNYSTEEKVVGKWIDGKPLYEKTVYFGSGTLSNRASVSFENMNIDKIMVISGTFEDTIDGQLSIPVYLDGTLHVGFYCNRSGILLTFSGAFNGRISNAYAIIQYTKTTD